MNQPSLCRKSMCKEFDALPVHLLRPSPNWQLFDDDGDVDHFNDDL